MTILDDVESPILRRFYQYYLEKRGDRAFPARADLDPVDFAYALGDITLIEVEYDPVRFKFRLDGSRHVERFGFDLTGRSLDEFPYPEMRQAIFDSYKDVIDHREPRRYFRDLESSGRWFRYETLLLPLSRDGKVIDMIVSAISFHDLQIPIEPN
ncbi:PAS domain-containing protein [Dongia sp.]|uniref:PAS domain-containing protein n=1 Tax=Dongia sp. TaxID=1977262 RepID=UPI0037508F13